MHDLPAADAVYHQTCSVNFHTKKQLLKVYEMGEQPPIKERKVGRPQDEEKRDAFLKVAKFLEENDDEQTTVNDIMETWQEEVIAFGLD